MTAKQAKVILLKYLLYEKKYLGAFTECFGNSDIFGIKSSLYTTEVEIKVTKSDLQSELKTIKWILAGEPRDAQLKWIKLKKYYKHKRYLTGEYATYYWPNEFYFAVPTTDLAQLASDALKGTKYGVLILSDVYRNVGVFKKAEKMHEDKATTAHIARLIRKVSWENYGLRQKYELSKTAIV